MLMELHAHASHAAAHCKDVAYMTSRHYYHNERGTHCLVNTQKDESCPFLWVGGEFLTLS